MSETAEILNLVASVQPDHTAMPNTHPVHESCLRSYGLLRLAKELVRLEWPHAAITVTIALADTIAESKRHPETKP